MLPRKLFVTPEELRVSYDEMGTLQAVADRYGVSKKLILNYMKRYGISRNRRGTPEDFKERIMGLAGEGKNGTEIASVLGITGTYVRLIAKQFGIKITDNFHKGYRITHNGYKAVRIPGHPDADATGYVRVHRLVAEKKLGRPLGPDEIVHHINGDKLDNRPENLEVMGRPSHNTHHHKGKPKGSHKRTVKI